VAGAPAPHAVSPAAPATFACGAHIKHAAAAAAAAPAAAEMAHFTLDRWAYAKLGIMPPEAFMVAAAQQMLHDMARSVPQDISNMLWVRWQSQRHALTCHTSAVQSCALACATSSCKHY
jgi:hypothetical protein